MAEILIRNTKVKNLKFLGRKFLFHMPDPFLSFPYFFISFVIYFWGKNITLWVSQEFYFVIKEEKKVVDGALTESGLTECVAYSLRGTTE